MRTRRLTSQRTYLIRIRFLLIAAVIMRFRMIRCLLLIVKWRNIFLKMPSENTSLKRRKLSYFQQIPRSYFCTLIRYRGSSISSLETALSFKFLFTFTVVLVRHLLFHFVSSVRPSSIELFLITYPLLSFDYIFFLL